MMSFVDAVAITGGGIALACMVVIGVRAIDEYFPKKPLRWLSHRALRTRESKFFQDKTGQVRITIQIDRYPWDKEQVWEVYDVATRGLAECKWPDGKDIFEERWKP
jgi:hypothetical protein